MSLTSQLITDVFLILMGWEAKQGSIPEEERVPHVRFLHYQDQKTPILFAFITQKKSSFGLLLYLKSRPFYIVFLPPCPTWSHGWRKSSKTDWFSPADHVIGGRAIGWRWPWSRGGGTEWTSIAKKYLNQPTALSRVRWFWNSLSRRLFWRRAYRDIFQESYKMNIIFDFHIEYRRFEVTIKQDLSI